MGQEEEDVEPKNIVSEVAYNEYIALIAHIDGEKYFLSRQDDDKPFGQFTKSGNIITAQCAKYRRALNEYLRRYNEFNRISQNPEGNGFDNHLYNPACFVAFGDTDNIVITTADDFYFTERLALLSNVPIRQTSLSFCPKLDSLGIKSEPFCELPLVLNGCAPKLEKGQDLEATDSSAHPFIEQRPLLAVTYYKLNGMAVLGPGLLMQQAVYKAMAKKITEVWAELKQKTLNKESFFTDIMSHEDVLSFRCVFLDPQGWSDIVTLMFCTNYSVIASILAFLRTLTMKDIYNKAAGGKTLEEAVDCFKIHKEVAQLASKLCKKNIDKRLADNHVFCSTFTSLGMSHKSFIENNGHILEKNRLIADTYLKLCCGHDASLRKSLEEHKKYPAPFLEAMSPDYNWYMVGHNDFSYRQILRKDVDINKTVLLKDLVKQIKDMRFFTTANEKNHQSEPHILDSTSELRIPMPVTFSKDADQKGMVLPEIEQQHFEARYILEDIRKKLFEENPDINTKNQEIDGYPCDFNVKFLLKKLIKLRVPTPLSNAILYLYTDFSNYLSDPFLFDSVIDLLDVFTATYRLLTKKLPLQLDERTKELKSKYADKSKLAAESDCICRSFMTTTDIENLLSLFKLLQNALANRVQIAFLGAERWNRSIDIRGIGLNKILSAADSPLKCGLGILRRVIKGDTAVYHPQDNTEFQGKTEKEHDKDIRTKIGGASDITYNPRTLYHRLIIGDNPDFFLSYIDSNIGHLSRPHAFYIHFHEFAHLVCHFLRNKAPCKHKNCRSYRGGKKICHRCSYSVDDDLSCADFERYEEIFAEMLIHKFVFGKDYQTYLNNYMANYALDPIAYDKEDYLTFLRLFEILLRGFLITDPFCQEAKDKQIYSDKYGNLRSIANEAFDRFYTTVQKAGALFFDFNRFWDIPGKKRLKKYFLPAYKESYYTICCIWADVQKIYNGVCVGNEEKKIWGTDPEPTDKDKLIKMIKNGYTEGKPLIRVLYKDPRVTRTDEPNNRLDVFFLITNLLKTHITKIYNEEGINAGEHLTLLRDLDGDPIKPPNGGKLHTWLLDRTLNGVVSAVPKSRGEFIQKIATVIKTFWDISTNLRARRMEDLLELYKAKLNQKS